MRAHRIAAVEAIPLNVALELGAGKIKKATSLSCCLVKITTDQGLVGHGFTAITEEEVIAAIVRDVAAPALIGVDPMRHERIWEDLYWLLAPRGQTGYAAHAIAAIDLALWDIKGKVLDTPVWRLLGGARSTVPLYATFGFGFFDRAQLAEAAREWRDRGFKRLKMTVGNHALARRDEPRPLSDVIREDVARVRAVRDAVGPEVELYLDANCGLDQRHAIDLAQRVEEFGITFFEEPITQNDVRLMADMRRRTKIPLACGQNEGLGFRFRDLFVAHAIDVAQPNVAITGGITQCLRIAGMAQAFNVPIANGGAWPFHNMHLHAGLANGGLVEYHAGAIAMYEAIYDDLPAPRDG
ncbi:MAG: mandelate racemase/muconate lactonizing enzyme family protein, partial [Burkholderiales bacterium]